MQSFDIKGASLNICRDPGELVEALAGRFVELAAHAVASRGIFSVALSGGSTPRALYAMLASPPFKDRLDWARVHLFWGDERCVPHDSPESNFRMVKDVLIDAIDIPDGNVHATCGQERDPAAAAREYEAEIRSFFKLEGQAQPRFDLILLGLGPDGHTASLFPSTTALEESAHAVAAVFVERLQAYRITMTLPAINNGRDVVFMVSGSEKKDILARVLTSTKKTLPSQYVKPEAGHLSWFVDEQASAALDVGSLTPGPTSPV